MEPLSIAHPEEKCHSVCFASLPRGQSLLAVVKVRISLSLSPPCIRCRCLSMGTGAGSTSPYLAVARPGRHGLLTFGYLSLRPLIEAPFWLAPPLSLPFILNIVNRFIRNQSMSGSFASSSSPSSQSEHTLTSSSHSSQSPSTWRTDCIASDSARVPMCSQALTH